MKVVNEDRQMEQKIVELVADWDRKKPMGGDVHPDEAVNRIHIFEQQFLRVKEVRFKASVLHVLHDESDCCPILRFCTFWNSRRPIPNPTRVTVSVSASQPTN